MFQIHFSATMKWSCLLSVFLVACSNTSDDMPKIAPVSGVVTLDGQPLPEAEILFQPTSGRASTGVSDENGEYTLLFNRNTYGAKVDDHDVSIITYKQFDETLSKLTATVTEGENVINLDLKSKPKTKSQTR
ncbi:MAG: carboxypeptidase-like regulatory domain-containing protein [Planctomycetota bacterium]